MKFSIKKLQSRLNISIKGGFTETILSMQITATIPYDNVFYTNNANPLVEALTFMPPPCYSSCTSSHAEKTGAHFCTPVWIL